MNERNDVSRLGDSAQGIAASAESWADLSNALFDPENGLVSKAYPTKAERSKFIKSSDYNQLRALINEVVQRTGLVAGATPKAKSGKFVVRLPKTLHAALDDEAKREGVSLNQLVVAKLAAQMTEIFPVRSPT